jgi:hypothetical protein
MTVFPAARRYLLTASDMKVIAQGTTTLPGVWYLDSVIDLRRQHRPRAWVRSRQAVAGGPLAVSFERIGTAIWIAIDPDYDDHSVVTQGVPFATFQAAFVYLWFVLAAATSGVDAASKTIQSDHPLERRRHVSTNPIRYRTRRPTIAREPLLDARSGDKPGPVA